MANRKFEMYVYSLHFMSIGQHWSVSDQIKYRLGQPKSDRMFKSLNYSEFLKSHDSHHVLLKI